MRPELYILVGFGACGAYCCGLIWWFSRGRGRTAKRLVQIPIGGQWVEPASIRQVHAFPPHFNPLGHRIGPMLIVITADGNQIMVDCDSYDCACGLRDHVAAIANGESVPALGEVSIPAKPRHPLSLSRIRVGKDG